MNFKKLPIFVFLFFVFFISTGFSYEMEIFIDEQVTQKIVDYTRVDVSVKGTVEITNPTPENNIYEFFFKFRDDVYFQLNLLSGNLTFSDKEISGRFIVFNSTKSFDYTLEAVLPKAYYDSFYNENISMFEWYLSDANFLPLKYASLNKLNRDHSNTTNISNRNVIVEGINPTLFDVSVNYVNLYKTDSNTGYLDFYDEKNLLQSFSQDFLGPNGNFEFEVVDLKSDDTSVYWIEYSIVTKNNFTSNVTISSFSPKPPESSGGGSSSKESGGGLVILPIEFSKISDKGILSYGDKLNISLLLMNPNSFTIYNLSIEDSFPSIFGLDSNTILAPASGDMFFEIDSILARETKVINYTLNFEEEYFENLIYISYAKLFYDDETIYSNSLNLINDHSDEDRKLFIEKSIFPLEDNLSKVVLKVRNIGKVSLKDIFIVDTNYSLVGLSIKDYAFSDGWLISNLGVDEVWETSYLIEGPDTSNYVPEVFGVSNVKVFKTILVHEDVETVPIRSGLRFYEKLLVGIGLFLLFIDIVY